MAKMESQVLCAVLLLVCLSAVCCGQSPPVWPKKFMVSGTLKLPYAELNEPFMAFIDTTVQKSRIDYYGNTVQTMQMGAQGSDYGTTYMIAPMTTYDVLNKRSCFQTNGTQEGPVGPQSALPDLTFFKLVQSEMRSGRPCDVWQNVTVVGYKKNIYTMWVEQTTRQPVRYEMQGYDSLLGSHYDKYYLDYFTFDTTFSDNVFDVPQGLQCGGFPGPGVQHKALLNPMAEFVSGHRDHVHDAFHDFKAQHSKSYDSEKEEARHLAVFHNNLRYIHSMNRAGLTYTLAVNHLADLTPSERQVLRARKHSEGYNGGLPFAMKENEAANVPDTMDWRLYGAVTPVKDQAVCGSCWSFGTTGTIEGAYFLKTGHLVRLSQQELIDCSWGEGNNGCDGGEDFRAYHWIMKNGGLATEMDYGQYEAIDGYCHAANTTKTVMLKGFVNVTSGDLDALKVAIAKNGPVSVGIDASHPSLSFYANGVYYEPACGNKPDDLDHAVLAVGYGEMNGEKYWLVKNSWSTYWGNDGYVLMSQRDNNCGVATDATHVVL